MITIFSLMIQSFPGGVGRLLSENLLSVFLPLHLILGGVYGASPGSWPTLPPTPEAQTVETRSTEVKEEIPPEPASSNKSQFQEELETARRLEAQLADPNCKAACHAVLSRHLFHQYLDRANAYGQFGQYAEAEVYFYKVEPLLKIVPPKERASLEGRFLQQRALWFKDRGDFEAAERDLQKSLQLLQQSGDTQNYWISKSVSASLAMAQGRYRHSIAIYQEVLKAREKLLGPTDPRLGYVLNNFGEVYRDLRQWDKAEALYLRTQ